MKAKIDTLYGVIRSEWVRKKSSIEIELEIPVNTDAKVVFPKVSLENLLLDGNPIAQFHKISIEINSMNEVELILGSGIYDFSINY